MAGTAVPLAPVTGLYMNSGVGGSGGGGTLNTGLNASDLNAFRISAALDRLFIHLNSNDRNDATEFLNICLSLSRGIDFAIANNELPSRSRDFPPLIKLACQNKNHNILKAAIMVLMISVKSACLNGWFSDVDSEELSNLATEIASDFCSESNFKSEPSSFLSVISTIMSRYFPRLELGQIFVFLRVKPGPDAYVSDFQIAKNLKSSPGSKIRLFVVQTDSIETSSCLVAPAKVNFLLNGMGLVGRTTPFVDTGPQIPTVVPMLKYGSNLLQAVGEFNGNYIIAVAFMSEVPNPDSNAIQDYEQHAPATTDADTEVIVGPSRISLNCPISSKRIKTPVKGHSCKHIQCFDYDNYLDINSRRPSWRCPHCNQHVCFCDLRIDQKMVKILKEVGPGVSDIIVSSDGSWNVAVESDDTIEKPEDKTFNGGQDESLEPADVMDLTQTEDGSDGVAACETEDKKHLSKAHERQILTQSDGHVEDDVWSGIYISTFGPGSSNVRPNAQTAVASCSTSVLTESFTSPNREFEAFLHNIVTTSTPQTGTSLLNTLLLQQYQFGNQSITNAYGRPPSSVHSHVTRTSNAVQALPAQTHSYVQNPSSTHGLNSFVPNGLSAASQTPPAAPNLTTSRANPRQVSLVTSSSSPSPLLQNSVLQQNHPVPPARPPQQMANFRMPRAMIQSPGGIRPSFQSPGGIRPSFQSPGGIRPSFQSPGSFSLPLSHAGIPQDRSFHRPPAPGTQQSHLLAAANRAVQMSVDATRTLPPYSWNTDGRSIPIRQGDQRGISGVASQPATIRPGDQRGISGVESQSATRTDAYNLADPNWRPTSRMRGALSGQAYADALNQYIIRPNQQARSARPISNMGSLPAIPGSQLQSFMARGTVQGVPAPNYASAAPGVRPAGSDILPDGSSGMH